MTKSILKSGLLIATMGLLLSFDLPTGWIKRGSDPDKYEMAIERGVGQNSKNAATIKSIEKKIDGFGTLMQTCLPGKYLGKRVKMTGYLRSKNVSDWASFWMRVDRADTTLQADSVLINSVSFDNMEDRPIKGTTDWKKYEVVLDVPSNTSRISFGGMLIGTGQIWFDNLNFEIVDKSVTVTKPSEEGPGFNMERKKYNNTSALSQPANLNFEE